MWKWYLVSYTVYDGKQTVPITQMIRVNVGGGNLCVLIWQRLVEIHKKDGTVCLLNFWEVTDGDDGEAGGGKVVEDGDKSDSIDAEKQKADGEMEALGRRKATAAGSVRVV